jgi:hypothetical protein
MDDLCPCGGELAWVPPSLPWEAGCWVCEDCDRLPERCSCPVFCKTCFRPLGLNDSNPCDLHTSLALQPSDF